VRLLLVLGAAVVAAAVATAMVALGHHYFTDAVAGTAVGVGMMLLTALLIDWAVGSPRAWSSRHRARDSLVTAAPHVTISSPGPVGR
jgi:membrane-associated phospholipid phosphatase